MVAGAVRRAGRMANPHVRMLERRLEKWHDGQKKTPRLDDLSIAPPPIQGTPSPWGKTSALVFNMKIVVSSVDRVKPHLSELLNG